MVHYSSKLYTHQGVSNLPSLAGYIYTIFKFKADRSRGKDHRNLGERIPVDVWGEGLEKDDLGGKIALIPEIESDLNYWREEGIQGWGKRDCKGKEQEFIFRLAPLTNP